MVKELYAKSVDDLISRLVNLGYSWSFDADVLKARTPNSHVSLYKFATRYRERYLAHDLNNLLVDSYCVDSLDLSSVDEQLYLNLLLHHAGHWLLYLEGLKNLHLDDMSIIVLYLTSDIFEVQSGRVISDIVLATDGDDALATVDESTIIGKALVTQGPHSIVVLQNTVVLDPTRQLRAKELIKGYYVLEQDTTINVYLLVDTRLYFVTLSEPAQVRLKGTWMSVNYKCEYEDGYTVISSVVFAEPIVLYRFINTGVWYE